MGNDLKSLACEGEVAPSPNDVSEERVRSCLLDFTDFHGRHKY